MPRAALLSLLCVTSCADAEGRYDEFSRRSSAGGAGPAGAGGSCVPPQPGVLDGPALLAVETTLGAGQPILYRGAISTPELDGKTSVRFEYRAVDARDRRTLVGEALTVGPFAIDADGRFVADIPEQTLPGAANPILPGVPITSTLRLEAELCGVARFYCGTVSGSSTRPLIGAVSGNFGLTLLDPGDLGDLAPRYGCAPEAVALPLDGG